LSLDSAIDFSKPARHRHQGTNVKQVANQFCSLTRLVARYGEKNSAVILPNTDAEGGTKSPRDPALRSRLGRSPDASPGSKVAHQPKVSTVPATTSAAPYRRWPEVTCAVARSRLF